MGSTYIDALLPGELTPDQLRDKFGLMQDQARAEHGSSYSGDWNMCGGLHIVSSPTFASKDEAFKHVNQYAQKWEAAWAVRCRVQKRVVQKEPTFNKKPLHSSGGVLDLYRCVCLDRSGPLHAPPTIVPADQLTPTQQNAVREATVALYNAAKEKDEAWGVLQRAVNALFLHDNYSDSQKRAEVVETWLVAKPDWAAMRKMHTELVKATKLVFRTKAAMEKLDAKLTPTLCVSEDVEDGVRWYVGGHVAM